MTNFTIARKNMVTNQLLTNGINNHDIIDAFLSVPMEEFVPDNLKPVCYLDNSIKITPSRYMMSAFNVARMISSARVSKNDSVLNIGGGSGYSSAILASIAKKVVSIEPDSELASKANNVMNKLGMDNIIVLNTQIDQGYADSGPYDVIMISGAVPFVPEKLFEQLAENGRLIVPIDVSDFSGKVVLFNKKSDIMEEIVLFETKIPELPYFKEDND